MGCQAVSQSISSQWPAVSSEIVTVVLLMRDGVDLSLYRIAFHVDFKNTPAWFEQRQPRKGTSRSHMVSTR